MPAGVRVLEHTADTGIAFHGRTLKECLARAAAGMFASYLEVPPRRPGLAIEVRLEASGPDELLILWLEELLYLSEVRRLAFSAFEVTHASPVHLEGLAFASSLEEARPVGPAVKAVTRHELHLGPEAGGWGGRVIFDV